MSTFDDYAAQRRQEAQGSDAAHVSNLEGLGKPLGVACLVATAVLWMPSSGLSCIGVLVAAFAFAGDRVESKTIATMQDEPEKRTNTLATGCGTLLVMGIATVAAVMAAVYVLNGGKL